MNIFGEKNMFCVPFHTLNTPSVSYKKPVLCATTTQPAGSHIKQTLHEAGLSSLLCHHVSRGDSAIMLFPRLMHMVVCTLLQTNDQNTNGWNTSSPSPPKLNRLRHFWPVTLPPPLAPRFFSGISLRGTKRIYTFTFKNIWHQAKHIGNIWSIFCHYITSMCNTVYGLVLPSISFFPKCYPAYVTWL